jgi:hypothetical protein
MPIRRPDYDRMIAEREEEARESERAERRYWIVALLVCFGWCVVGGAVTVLGFVLVLPRDEAMLLVDAGWGIAAAGVLLTVVVAYHRRRARGVE